MSLGLKKQHGMSNPIQVKGLDPCPSKSFINLPKDIIQRICSNLPTVSIVNLSLTNKKIHAKCHGMIYRNIRIQDQQAVEEDPDELIIQNHFMHFKDESLEVDHWFVHLHETQIHNFKCMLMMIYQLIKDESLCQMVESIKIESKLKPNPFERLDIDRSIWDKTLIDILSNDELQIIEQLGFDISLSLFKCLKIFINKCSFNLKKIWIPYFPLRNVERLLNVCPLESIVEFKMMIYKNDPPNVKLNFQSLKSLKRFRLMFQENTEMQLKSLSESFGCIANQIEELQLKYDKTDFNYLTHPTWFTFFKYLNTPMKNLKRLKLKHCFFDDKQEEIVNGLSNVVPFEKLEWLSLQIYEHSHKSYQCFGQDLRTVLSYLVPKLKALKSFTFKGSNDCIGCQYRSIMQSLNLLNGLDELIIFTNTSSEYQYNLLINKIQSLNINKVGFFDEWMSLELIKHFKQYFQYETGLKFDSFKNYLVEIRRQDRNTWFEGYIMDSFNRFNTQESELVCSFWLNHLPKMGLLEIIKSSKEVKLFGFNFKCDVRRKMIMFYTGNEKGYVDLMYY